MLQKVKIVMSDNKMICYCAEVSEADIRQALADGANNLEEIKSKTGACTMGRCFKMNPAQT